MGVQNAITFGLLRLPAHFLRRLFFVVTNFHLLKFVMHRTNVLKLYKTILRLHRALPSEMRELGDQYVRDEFRRHKDISKEFVAPFIMEWSEYGVTLAKQIGLRGPKTASKQVGKPLNLEKLDDFESQQIYQLYQLRKSIAPIPEDDDNQVDDTNANVSSSSALDKDLPKEKGS